MSISLYEPCIEQLELPQNKPRKLDVISKYLKSLKNFMLLLNDSKENIQGILDKISLALKLKKVKKNEIIVNEGEKGKEFYILLKGKICVLTPKINEYYMSIEEYILYLFQLRLKDQNELIQKCISLNQNVFPINEDSFDIFVYNLSQGKTITESYSKYANLILKAKSVYQYILEQKNKLETLNEEDIQNKKKIIISPEEYIIQNSATKEIINNTKLIENYLKKLENDNGENNIEENNESKEDDDEEKNKKLLNNRNKVIIPSHEIFGDIEIGSYFGEMALEEKGSGKRNATLIAIEDSYIGALTKKDYSFILYYYIEKALNKYLNFISTFYIFKNLSLTIWEKRYISFFINRVYEKDYLLLKEGEKNDQVYFIYKGEFEITLNKNIIEVNELIINYKKMLRELLTENRNANFNIREMIKFCDIKEEMKENDNFIINKKFKGEKFKKMIFDKKLIKVGILSSKEIIGLLDIYSPIKTNKNDFELENENFKIKAFKMVSLFNCKCLSCNCEVYSFPLSKFKHMLLHEDKVGVLSNEVTIQKIYYMIKRLKDYKEYLFEYMYLKENENKEEIKEMKNKHLYKGMKNKFESINEFSILNLKTDRKLFNKKLNSYFFNKVLLNSYSNYKFHKSFDKNRNKFKLNNLYSQQNIKFFKNKERLKIKQKFLNFPMVEDSGKNIEHNSNKKTIKLDNQKSKMIFPVAETNNSINLTAKKIIVENNIKNILNEEKNSLLKSNNSRNSFFNIDKFNTNIFSKKPLIKKHNWVAKVMINNIVYNNFFDKYAFSSLKKSNNGFCLTEYDIKKKHGKFELENSMKNKSNSKQKKIIIKSNNNNEKNINIVNKNETETAISSKKFEKSLSNISKIKNIKMNIIKDNKIKSCGIYDALVYDDFNKCFNENIYKKFFGEKANK